MFTHKLFIAAALLGAAGLVYSLPKTSSKVAPLSASEAKLKKSEVHGVPLKVGTASISYGIVGVAWPRGYYQASQREFPHARSHISGGCVVSSDSPKFQAVKFRPKCRLNEKQWADAHKRTSSNR